MKPPRLEENGKKDAFDIEITDYIPQGWMLGGASVPQWTPGMVGSTGISASTTVNFGPNGLTYLETAQVSIWLIADL